MNRDVFYNESFCQLNIGLGNGVFDDSVVMSPAESEMLHDHSLPLLSYDVIVAVETVR